MLKSQTDWTNQHGILYPRDGSASSAHQITQCVVYLRASPSRCSWVQLPSLQSFHLSCGREPWEQACAWMGMSTASWRVMNFRSQIKSQTWAMTSNPPETPIHCRSSHLNAVIFTFFLLMVKVWNKSEKITYWQNPRSQRKKHQETAALSANCRCSMKWVQKLHVPTKVLELTLGVANENEEHKSLSLNYSSDLSL